MESHAATGTRPSTARAIALVTALLVGVLGLSAPAAAQALDGHPPTGTRSVSGTISFPASAPANVRKALDWSDQGPSRAGVYLSLSVDKPGRVDGWNLGADGNVHYDQNTGAWSVTGVGDARYRLTINVILPNYGYVNGTSRTLTVNGGNVNVGTTPINEDGRLNVVSISCESALSASAITAKNTATGRSYPIVSSQSGWFAPHARCSDGAVYANYHLAGAPAGDYTVSFSQQGITEYYSGGDVGTLDPAKAATVTTKSWEGTQTRMMYGLARPIAAKTPTISGTVKTGSTLKASAGRWTSGASFTYQWQRNGAPIANATKSSYKLSSSDLSKRITVRVTGVRAGYWPAAKTSSAILKTSKPKVKGTKKVGRTLKVSRGSWTTGTKFSYRWYRNGKAIKGATKVKYKLKAADAGKRIKVKVTGKKSGYARKSRTSSYTSRIKR